MRKFYTVLAVIALGLITSFQPAFANGNNTLSDKKAVLSILVKQINRDAIQELRLNEMQYIRLKELNKNYRQDMENLKSFSVANPSAYDAHTTELSDKYFAALNEILTQQQISVYLQKQLIAQNN